MLSSSGNGFMGTKEFRGIDGQPASKCMFAAMRSAGLFGLRHLAHRLDRSRCKLVHGAAGCRTPRWAAALVRAVARSASPSSLRITCTAGSRRLDAVGSAMDAATIRP